MVRPTLILPVKHLLVLSVKIATSVLIYEYSMFSNHFMMQTKWTYQNILYGNTEKKGNHLYGFRYTMKRQKKMGKEENQIWALCVIYKINLD